ncbi:MAG: LLM class flavin-dependent oxidoreductase, partial [Acidimicrobiaceae bacterium]|nr:LLM class flavin-dependent oxidoreductase [Acidimicrobiaceae bacterium]
PRNGALAAGVADGWLPMGYGSEGTATYAEPLARGRACRASGLRAELEVFGSLSVQITDDVRASVDARKPLVAMYVGGMGSDTHNFHAEAMARRGWPEASDRIVELWRAGRRDDAVAAVPDDYIESQSLLGSPERIRARWSETVPAGLTGVIVRCNRDAELVLAADLAGTRDAAGTET